MDRLFGRLDNDRPSWVSSAMNWDDFDAFCQVIERGGFTAAARAMDRPKSSVSAAIARLEDELQTRLLQRTTRRVRPTETGESLYRNAAPAFRRLREVRGEIIGRGDTVSGTLRVAAPYEFGAHHLGVIACRMLAQHPELRIEIEVVHGEVDLLGSGYDILFTVVERSLPDSGLVARRMFAIERALYAAPALLDAQGRPGSPEELSRLPLLARQGDTHWELTNAQERTVEVPIDARLITSNAEVRRQAAIDGLGVARITATYCEPLVAQRLLERVLPDWRSPPMRIYALVPARRLMPAKVRSFLERVAASAQAI